VNNHYDIVREKEHGSTGKLVGHGLWKDPLGFFQIRTLTKRLLERNLVRMNNGY
jgi:hypothetical protein